MAILRFLVFIITPIVIRLQAKWKISYDLRKIESQEANSESKIKSHCSISLVFP
jgi:hypothetical protein